MAFRTQSFTEKFRLEISQLFETLGAFGRVSNGAISEAIGFSGQFLPNLLSMRCRINQDSERL